MGKYFCPKCDMGFYSYINSDCPGCRGEADLFEKHQQFGFVGVYTLQEAVAILGKQLVPWKYAHRPILGGNGYITSKPVDSYFVYFVDSAGTEVAAWSIKLKSLQIFETPRKVDRDVFPDGEVLMFKGFKTPEYF